MAHYMTQKLYTVYALLIIVVGKLSLEEKRDKSVTNSQLYVNQEQNVSFPHRRARLFYFHTRARSGIYSAIERGWFEEKDGKIQLTQKSEIVCNNEILPRYNIIRMIGFFYILANASVTD